MIQHFSFYGIRLSLNFLDERFYPLAEWLDEDFSFFSSQQNSDKTDVVIDIRSSSELPENRNRKKSPLFITRLCRAYGWSHRWCDYGDDHWVHINPRSLATIYGKDPDLTYEILFTLILSRVGEELELQGYCRIHAFGFGLNGHNFLACFPSGVGKSHLAIQTLQKNIPIYSDEITLLKNNIVKAFPMRIALTQESLEKLKLPAGRSFKRKVFDEKQLYQVPVDLIANELSSRNHLIYGRTSDETGIQAAGLFMKCRIFISILLGLGLPQMREFLLRRGCLTKIPRIAFLRAITALRLLKQPVAVLDLSKNNSSNHDFLMQFTANKSKLNP